MIVSVSLVEALSVTDDVDPGFVQPFPVSQSLHNSKDRGRRLDQKRPPFNVISPGYFVHIALL